MGAITVVLTIPSILVAGSLAELLRNSPFGGPAPKPAAAEASAVLELRGVVTEGGETWLTFYNSSTKKWTTLRKGDEEDALAVRDFDRTKDTAFVTLAGKTAAVSLKATLRQSSGPVALIARMASNSPALPPVFVPGPPVAEIQRLEEVANVIRQRRTERTNQTSGTPNRS